MGVGMKPGRGACEKSRPWCTRVMIYCIVDEDADEDGLKNLQETMDCKYGRILKRYTFKAHYSLKN